LKKRENGENEDLKKEGIRKNKKNKSLKCFGHEKEVFFKLFLLKS